MKRLLMGFAFLVALNLNAAQPPETDLVGGELKILGDQFGFTEGPVTDKTGDLYFTDIRNNRIHTYTTEGTLKIFRENSGGANGLYFDPQGALFVCEGNNGRLTSITRDGEYSVLADRYDDKRFNKPNDLWVDPRGGVYFTDPAPRRGKQTQDGSHVYYLPPDRSGVIRIIGHLKRPNGIIGSVDGKLLYVADTGANLIWRYDILPDGSLNNKTFFAGTRCDGMTLDEKGNLYVTAGSVLVFTPSGQLLANIDTPDRPSNVTFGGKDNRTLFITARNYLLSLKMNVSGRH